MFFTTVQVFLRAFAVYGLRTGRRFSLEGTHEALLIRRKFIVWTTSGPIDQCAMRPSSWVREKKKTSKRLEQCYIRPILFRSLDEARPALGVNPFPIRWPVTSAPGTGANILATSY